MSGSERYTFDTNIFFYAIDRGAGEKHHLADQLIRRSIGTNAVILIQTMGELYHAVLRKQRSLAGFAREYIQTIAEVFPLIGSTGADLLDALSMQDIHGLQFRDAILSSTARRSGCKLLFSEDLQDGRRLDGLLFRNPFRMSSSELDLLLNPS